MDFADEKECIIFDDEAVALIAPQKRRISFGWRITVWCMCAVLAVAFLVMAATGVFGRASEALNGGTSSNLNGVPILTDDGAKEDFFESDSESESTSMTENVEQQEESETEISGVLDVISVDLSFAEKGDGYLYNFSNFEPDAEGLIEMGFDAGDNYFSNQPLVLVLHTHIREGYWDLNEDEPTHLITKSVVAVGEQVVSKLNQLGVASIHCTVIHGEGGIGAYTDAAETIKYMLELYPTIKYVIDLHRLDQIDEDGRAVRTVSANGNGQIRLTVSSEGNDSQETLALALSLRRKLNANNRRECMPVVFTSVSFNATKSPHYLKVDIGSLGNKSDEAMAAGDSFAIALAELLKG